MNRWFNLSKPMILRILSTALVFSSLILIGFSQEPERGGESPHKGKRAPGKHFDGFIKHHDRDQDGKVSPAEFAEGERAGRLSEEARGKIFARLDKDSDGFITGKELRVRERGMPKPFLKKADRDGDGRISREEFLANPVFKRAGDERLNKMFDRMDQNQDGFLDQKDREAGRDKRRPPRGNQRELDLDQNGTIDFEEFQKAPWVGRMPQNERERIFKSMDGNEDGEISVAELRRHLEKRSSKSSKEPRPRKPKK